jgi:signal transduction histidine kinase
VLFGDRFSLEHGIVTADGEQRIVRHVGALVDHDDPRGTRLVGAVLDITDDKSLELLKDALIATASHELRTPLTSIVGFAETLARSWDEAPEEARLAWLTIIRDQAQRLSAIVDDTLLQARVDNRMLQPHLRAVPLAAAVEHALVAFEDGQSELQVRVPEHLRVLATVEHLARIVTNLVSNAHKYGAPPVMVEGRAADGRVLLRVSDAGPGVDESFEPRLFDRFARGAGTADKPGTGLGLSIVRGMAEAMGGTVRYLREDGRTVFEVSLAAATGGGDTGDGGSR